MSSTKFNAAKFLTDKWASPTHLLAFARTYGVSYKFQTVYRWFERESIPSDVLPVLLALLELETGQPVSIAKYLVVEP